MFKRKDREINIVSLSYLDVLSGALAVFIIIVMILIPYYKNETPDLSSELLETKKQLEESMQREQEARQQAENAQSGNQELERRLEGCLDRLSNTFLAVVMKWSSKGDDIDLHVIAPDGNEFYYDRHNRNGVHFRSSSAELSVDTIYGPGVEIWEHPLAKPGIYKIYYKFYNDREDIGGLTIKGSIYYRDGSIRLSDVRLNRKGDTKLIATITVKENGEVDVSEH